VKSAPGHSRRDRTHKQRLRRLESLIREQHWPTSSVAVDPTRCAAAGPGSRRNTAAAESSQPDASEVTEEVYRITQKKDCRTYAWTAEMDARVLPRHWKLSSTASGWCRPRLLTNCLDIKLFKFCYKWSSFSHFYIHGGFLGLFYFR